MRLLRNRHSGIFKCRISYDVYFEVVVTYENNLDVWLNDTGRNWDEAEDYFYQAAQWAEVQCTSFIGYDIQDVSDVSYHYDQIALYRFNDEQDALMFKLKWK